MIALMILGGVFVLWVLVAMFLRGYYEYVRQAPKSEYASNPVPLGLRLLPPAMRLECEDAEDSGAFAAIWPLVLAWSVVAGLVRWVLWRGILCGLGWLLARAFGLLSMGGAGAAFARWAARRRAVRLPEARVRRP